MNIQAEQTPAKVPRRASIAELAEIVGSMENLPNGITAAAIRKQMGRGGMEIGADHKVDTVEFLELRKRQKSMNRNSPHNQSIRDTKIEKEIELLQAKIDEIHRKMIPMQEHLDVLTRHAGLVNGVFDMWIQAVEVETKDTRLRKRAEEMRDRARSQIREEIEAEINAQVD